MFRFKAMADENKKDYPIFPSGDYDFVIKSATTTESKAGNPMLKLILIIKDEKGNETSLFDYVLEALKFKLKHFFESIDRYEEYKREEVLDETLVGLVGRCTIGVEDNDFGRKNVVIDYIKKKDVMISNDQEAFEDDAIPF